MLKLALQSLWARRLTAGLTLLAVAISVTLLLGVERVRSQARDSFANTVSGTDLIVGARSGQVNLLLYSVFRIGNPTNNVGWDSYQAIKARPGIAWTIPSPSATPTGVSRARHQWGLLHPPEVRPAAGARHARRSPLRNTV